MEAIKLLRMPLMGSNLRDELLDQVVNVFCGCDVIEICGVSNNDVERFDFYLFAGCVLCSGCQPAMEAQIGSPSSLPGKGLAQHDFLYAGESHDLSFSEIRLAGSGDKDQIITMAAKRNIPPDLVRVKTFRVIGHAHRLGMRLVDTVFYRRSCQ
jgi:hypothetical protein